MNRSDAASMAIELMNKHRKLGNVPPGWSFEWSRAKRQAGHCDYRDKMIRLSTFYVDLATPEQVKDTILHEIAHSSTAGDKHGPKWKRKCREIGAIPRSCTREIDLTKIPAKYQGICPSCQQTFRRHRLSSDRSYICPKYVCKLRGRLIEWRTMV